MEKNAALNPSKSFLVLKNINPRILLNFERVMAQETLKKLEKTPSSRIIHTLGGGYLRIIEFGF